MKTLNNKVYYDINYNKNYFYIFYQQLKIIKQTKNKIKTIINILKKNQIKKYIIKNYYKYIPLIFINNERFNNFKVINININNQNYYNYNYNNFDYKKFSSKYIKIKNNLKNQINIKYNIKKKRESIYNKLSLLQEPINSLELYYNYIIYNNIYTKGLNIYLNTYFENINNIYLNKKQINFPIRKNGYIGLINNNNNFKFNKRPLGIYSYYFKNYYIKDHYTINKSNND